MSVNTALVDHVGELIGQKGRIAFSEYMEAVLYHPQLGYYSSDRNPIGTTGDFYTAASLDPAMGQMLAKLFSNMASLVDGFELVEMGAGTGRLARHILETQAFPYHIIERSLAMRQRQEKTLESFSVQWHEELPDAIMGCVFSNEFFDALPVRRFVRRQGGLREVFVTGDSTGFREVEAEPEVQLELPLLAEGCRADVCLEASDWVRRIGTALKCGYHLAIDYGYLRQELFSRPDGTLMCYRGHQADSNPYAEVGQKDITAHVNFSDLIDSGQDCGLITDGFPTQMDFLIDLGILDLIEPLAVQSDAASIQRMGALKNLLLPPMMGERFKVLLQRKGLPKTDLPGFRRAPES